MKRNPDIDVMLREVHIRGGVTGALVVHSREDWEAVTEPGAPLQYDDLPVRISAWAPPGQVFAVAREIADKMAAQA